MADDPSSDLWQGPRPNRPPPSHPFSYGHSLPGEEPTRPRITLQEAARATSQAKFAATGVRVGPNVDPALFVTKDHGTWFSTEEEKNEDAIKYLASFSSKIFKDGNFITVGEDNFKMVGEDGDFTADLPAFMTSQEFLENARYNMDEAAQSCMIPLLIKWHQNRAEVRFRKRLRAWMLGRGDLAEYPQNVATWVKDEHYDKIADVETERDGLGADSLFEHKTLHDLLQSEVRGGARSAERAKKLRDVISGLSLAQENPNITQGFILESDIKEAQTRIFLEYLKKVRPRNDKEAYLFYKYIICKNKSPENLYAYISPTPPEVTDDEASFPASVRTVAVSNLPDVQKVNITNAAKAPSTPSRVLFTPPGSAPPPLESPTKTGDVPPPPKSPGPPPTTPYQPPNTPDQPPIVKGQKGSPYATSPNVKIEENVEKIVNVVTQPGPINERIRRMLETDAKTPDLSDLTPKQQRTLGKDVQALEKNPKVMTAVAAVLKKRQTADQQAAKQAEELEKRQARIRAKSKKEAEAKEKK